MTNNIAMMNAPLQAMAASIAKQNKGKATFFRVSKVSPFLGGLRPMGETPFGASVFYGSGD
jgi:hypothetical protein